MASISPACALAAAASEDEQSSLCPGWFGDLQRGDQFVADAGDLGSNLREVRTLGRLGIRMFGPLLEQIVLHLGAGCDLVGDHAGHPLGIDAVTTGLCSGVRDDDSLAFRVRHRLPRTELGGGHPVGDHRALGCELHDLGQSVSRRPGHLG